MTMIHHEALERGKTAQKAMDMALKAHGVQQHGSQMIGDHLADVARNVAIHYDPRVAYCPVWEVISAAWLHDTLEDTDLTFAGIEDEFGYRIAELVSLLTDKSGATRKDRHLKTYHAIRTDPDALLIKLCDRRHNHERSIRNQEHYMSMYEREYTYFKFALWTPHKFTKLWAELDDQYAIMSGKLKW